MIGGGGGSSIVLYNNRGGGGGGSSQFFFALGGGSSLKYYFLKKISAPPRLIVNDWSLTSPKPGGDRRSIVLTVCVCLECQCFTIIASYITPIIRRKKVF